MAYILESASNLGTDVNVDAGSPIGLLLLLTWAETTTALNDGYTRETENDSGSFSYETKNES